MECSFSWSSMLQQFKKKSNDQSAMTHTRIPDPSLNIYGGSYSIPEELTKEFYSTYYRHVFEGKNDEYMTEKQLENDSQILIDLDLKYKGLVEDKQYTKTDIFNIIFLVYLEKLKQILQFCDNTPFNIYVFEKPHVNTSDAETKGFTKDGIHIIIGTKLNRSLQLVLRQNVIEELTSSNIWQVPLINEWSNVIDESITRGSANWQLYGSKKPKHEAYELTMVYKVTFDNVDGEFASEEIERSQFFSMEMFPCLTARNKDVPSFPVKQEYYDIGAIKSHSKVASCSSIPYLKQSGSSTTQPPTLKVSHIINAETLDAEIEKMLQMLNPSTEFYIKETHSFAMILSAKYYEPGSHLLNRKLAFALKNTDFRLFLTWVKVRSKATDFDFNTIDSLFSDWCTYFNKGDYDVKGLTHKSIMYWAKEDSPQEFKQIKTVTIDYFVDIALKSGTDYDIAKTIYHIYKGDYVCVALNGNKPTWYRFERHRWVKDKGNSLRLCISNNFFELFEAKQKIYQQQLQNLYSRLADIEKSFGEKHAKESDEFKEKTKLAEIVAVAGKHIKKLKQCSDKNNIYRESSELFYDVDFLKKMDKNKYLVCFANGVVDLKNKLFRDGYPDDYITKSTNINYSPISSWLQTDEYASIEDFFAKLFPIQSMKEYMLDHLASCLIGENINQTFTIYRGRGSNGKSLLTDFMTLAFGEYAGTIPVTLITDKRTSIGGTQSELIQLKGVRYAIMQEPSKDAKINEGIMKQLTGDSQMQARELYCESESFTIQFSLVVSLNEVFKVCSNDNGTWRRIRVVDFLSKFKSESDVSYNALSEDIQSQGEEEGGGEAQVEFEFLRDPSLKDKLPHLAPCFASFLVHRVFETNGMVRNSAEVTMASEKYRREQDVIAQFVKEKIIRKEGNRMTETELKNKFRDFKKEENYSDATKPKELIEFMKLNFKMHTDKKSFLNIAFVPDNKTETSLPIEYTPSV